MSTKKKKEPISDAVLVSALLNSPFEVGMRMKEQEEEKVKKKKHADNE